MVGKEGKGLLALETTTTKKAEKDKAKKAHLWLLCWGMGFGRYVSSSTFSVSGHDWAQFYLDGATTGLLGDISGLLYYYTQDCDASRFRAWFTLNLLERDGKMPSVTYVPKTLMHMVYT